MAQQLAEIIAQVRQADTLLIGAHAVSMQQELLAELRLAKVRATLVDASLLLTAVSEALQDNASEERLSA